MPRSMTLADTWPAGRCDGEHSACWQLTYSPERRAVLCQRSGLAAVLARTSPPDDGGCPFGTGDVAVRIGAVTENESQQPLSIDSGHLRDRMAECPRGALTPEGVALT